MPPPRDQLSEVYKRKAKYGGLEVSDARRPRSLEEKNAWLREGCLNEALFTSLGHARQVLADWWHDYNHFRPYSSLGNRTLAGNGSRLTRQTGPGVTPQPGCCHHAQAWASNRARPKKLNIGLSRTVVTRPWHECRGARLLSEGEGEKPQIHYRRFTMLRF